jgi:arylsulfatase A-like enzyme
VRTAAALLALVPFLLPACGEPEEEPTTSRADAAAPAVLELPHVVLLLVDTFRADRLGVYGYERPTSPEIDALAEESVVFMDACAPAPWTLPSVVSLMLSSFAAEHGVVRDVDRIAPSAEPLAARLGRLGYRTASFFRNPYAGPMSGLDRGFDVVRLDRGEISGAMVEEWIEAAPPGPFFLYLHNTTPHDPYSPDAEHLRVFGEVTAEEREEIRRIQKDYRELTRANHPRGRPKNRPDNSPEQTEKIRLLDARRESIELLYDGEVRQADAEVGSIVRALKDAGLWEDTLFVLLSDHGEELGDHGGWQHDQSVYEELMHVPLLVHFPGGEHAGASVRAPVSLIDVLPTLLDYLGRPELAEGARGRSLMPLVRGTASDLGPRVTGYRINEKKSYTPYALERGDVNVVVRDGAWKGIWNAELDTFELYDLAADRAERHDLSAEEPDRARALLALARAEHARFEAAREATTESDESELSEEERELLRALGYLGDEE